MNRSDETPGRGRYGLPITREVLESGANLAALRALSLPGLVVRSDAEIEASLEAMLAKHPAGQDAWIFGYGSLMWNPAIHFVERRLGRLDAWQHRFCLRMYFGRATPERPGLMLALDEGGSCSGVLFRIAAAELRRELLLVWRREMSTGAYLARWVEVATEGSSVRAITFVINRDNPRYAGVLDDSEVATTLATAAGTLGSCTAYLEQTAEALRQLGVEDEGMARICARVDALRHAPHDVDAPQPGSIAPL